MRIARTLAGPDAPALPQQARLVLPFTDRSRSRLHATLDDGTPIGLMLPRGTVLRGGDRLRCEDGSAVVVVAAMEPVMDAHTGDAPTLARIAYHLGNRHALLEVGHGFVRFAADHVL